MSRHFRFWLASLVAIASGYAVAASIDLGRIFDVGKDLRTATTTIDEKEEVAIGREVAGRMLGAAPLVPDPALQAYVNRVGRWVASHSERPDLPWRFGVIDDSTINAFAAPGGYVLVTRGLYEILDNEAQLAGVFGHEIGHIVRQHHIKVMQDSALISAGARAAQRENRAAWQNSVIGSGAEVFARGLDKSAEFESDQMGIVLAARAGYNPFGLVEVLHKLSVRAADDSSLTLLFKTHPAPGERLEKIGEALKPHIAKLPPGREPALRQIAANVPPSPKRKPAAEAEAARALQQQEEGGGTTFQSGGSPSRSKGGFGVDPGGVLKGIFGR